MVQARRTPSLIAITSTAPVFVYQLGKEMQPRKLLNSFMQ